MAAELAGGAAVAFSLALLAIITLLVVDYGVTQAADLETSDMMRNRFTLPVLALLLVVLVVAVVVLVVAGVMGVGEWLAAP